MNGWKQIILFKTNLDTRSYTYMLEIRAIAELHDNYFEFSYE